MLWKNVFTKLILYPTSAYKCDIDFFVFKQWMVWFPFLFIFPWMYTKLTGKPISIDVILVKHGQLQKNYWILKFTIFLKLRSSELSSNYQIRIIFSFIITKWERWTHCVQKKYYFLYATALSETNLTKKSLFAYHHLRNEMS